MKRALMIIDYTESSCSERYERPEQRCTFSAVRNMAPRLSTLLQRFRATESGEVVWIRSCPWVPDYVHPNIRTFYADAPQVAFYNDGGGANFYRLTPLAGEPIFEKNLYSAFSGTAGKLETYLRERQIEKLIICGVYSTGCVDATICEAFHCGFQLLIVADCVETFDDSLRRDYQKHLLREWGYLYGKVESTTQLYTAGEFNSSSD
jgi:nicotinamidase-related amidase